MKQKEKRMKKHQQSLRDLWDTNKSDATHIVGIPEEERKKGKEIKFATFDEKH